MSWRDPFRVLDRKKPTRFADAVRCVQHLSGRERRNTLWLWRCDRTRRNAWEFSPEGSARAEENKRRDDHARRATLSSRAWPSFYEAIRFCGFNHGDDDPREINGNCVVCSVELTGRRKVFCSDECGNALHGRVYCNTNWIRRAVVKLKGATCNHCRTKLASPIRDGGPDYPNYDLIDIDHIEPLCMGGNNHVDNLQVLCKTCHKEKTKVDARRRSKRTHKEFPVPTPPLEGVI